MWIPAGIILLALLLVLCMCGAFTEGFIVADAQDIHKYKCLRRYYQKTLTPRFDDYEAQVFSRQRRPYVFNPIGANYYGEYLNSASPYDSSHRILSTSTKGLPGTEASHRLSSIVPLPANYQLPIV